MTMMPTVCLLLRHLEEGVDEVGVADVEEGPEAVVEEEPISRPLQTLHELFAGCLQNTHTIWSDSILAYLGSVCLLLLSLLPLSCSLVYCDLDQPLSP